MTMGIMSRITRPYASSAAAAEVGGSGVPCRVVIRRFQPLHMTNAAGDPLYAFDLTVVPQTGRPYLVKVGSPVPTEALPHMYPGAQLPATVPAHDPQGVVEPALH